MLLSAMCSRMVLLTQLYPQCAFETPNLQNSFYLKHIHAPPGNVSTHGASDAILFSVSIETPNLENYFHLSIFMLLRAMCLHMELLTQFNSQCAFETPI